MPLAAYEEQFVKHKPFGQPWDYCLMQVIAGFPRPFAMIIQAQRAIFIYVYATIILRPNPGLENPCRGNASVFQPDFNPVRFAVFRGGDGTDTCQGPFGQVASEAGIVLLDQIFLADVMPVVVGIASSSD